MIQIPVTIEITKGTLPMDFQFISDDPQVTFSKTVGTTTDNNITTTVLYPSSDLIDTATISVKLTNANCTQTIVLSIDNPCDNLTLGPIIKSGNKFSVSGSSPDCNALTFNWTYSDVLYGRVSKLDTSFTSEINLPLASNVNLPDSTTVKVKASCQGCEAESIFTYSFCKPQAKPVIAELFYNDGVFKSGTILLPDPEGCVGYNYSTYNLSLPDNWTYTIIGNQVIFTAPAGTTAASYLGSYTVTTDSGIISHPGTLTLVVNAYSGLPTIGVANKVWTLDCADTAGTVINLPIEDELSVATGAVVDWNSWQLLTNITPKSPSIVLDNVSGEYVIKYTVPNPVESDAFQWVICDSNGICTEAISYTVTTCNQAPIANDVSATVACGNSVTINPLANDVPNGSPLLINSIVVTSGPAIGTYTLPGDGTIIYQSEYNLTSSVEIVYKVKNAAGEFSNEATITIDIDCAGADSNVTICN